MTGSLSAWRYGVSEAALTIYIYIYIQSHSTFSRPAPGPWPGSRSCRLRPEPQVWKDQCLGGRPQAEGIRFSSAMSWKSMEIPHRNGGFIWFYMVLYGFIWFYMFLYDFIWFNIV